MNLLMQILLPFFSKTPEAQPSAWLWISASKKVHQLLYRVSLMKITVVTKVITIELMKSGPTVVILLGTNLGPLYVYDSSVDWSVCKSTSTEVSPVPAA